MYNNELDQIRNLMGILNRNRYPSDVDTRAVSDMYSPPYKNRMAEMPKDHIGDAENYPRQLSGLHGSKKQQINISGDTSGQNASGFRGV